MLPVLAMAVVLLALAGCGGDDPEEAASPLAACNGLTVPPAEAPLGGGAAGGDPAPLPDLDLPCHTGGEPFHLADLRGPAVVNLWASWCGPCRDELPLLQELAEARAGEVHVLGVVTADDPGRAAALATDLGVIFPALDDRDRRLMTALGVQALPATLFVDRAGRVAHLHATGPYDQAGLADLVQTHLGVPGS